MADSGNKQNAHAPPSGNPVPHLCVLVCVPYLRPPNTVVHLPLTPFDFFFPLLFLILPLFLFSCAIHLRACKIRDAPTSLACWETKGVGSARTPQEAPSATTTQMGPNVSPHPRPHNPPFPRTPYPLRWLTH